MTGLGQIGSHSIETENNHHRNNRKSQHRIKITRDFVEWFMIHNITKSTNETIGTSLYNIPDTLHYFLLYWSFTNL